MDLLGRGSDILNDYLLNDYLMDVRGQIWGP